MGPNVTVRCASCGHNFDTKIHGNLACPYCHAQVYLEPNEHTSDTPQTELNESAPDPTPTASTTASVAPANEEPPPRADEPKRPAYRLDLLISSLTQLAWEGHNYGIIQRFWASMKQILFTPSVVFTDLGIRDIKKSLWFGWIVCSLGLAFFFIYNIHFHDANRDFLMERAISDGATKTQAEQILDAQRSSYQFGAYGGFLLLAFVNIWMSALLNHLGVLIAIGKKNRGFRATLKGTAYSFAPFLFLVIPLPPLVLLIALVWSITIQIIAIGKMHHSNLARASQAVLLPLFAVMLLMMLPIWI